MFAPPFVAPKYRSLLFAMAEVAPDRLTQLCNDVMDLIPLEVQDAYHFLDTVFQVRNAFYQAPKGMTLNRFRYLLHELVRVEHQQCVLSLDPLSTYTDKERSQLLQFIEHDTYTRLNNVMVYCIGVPGKTILALQMGSEGVVTFTDKSLIYDTPHGVFSMTLRVFFPCSVSSESVRENYLRQLASCSSLVSVRTSLLLTDPMFPLNLIPEIGTVVTLESVACSVSHVTLDQIVGE